VSQDLAMTDRAGGQAREFGLERGRIYPLEAARQLENPLRRLIASPRRLAERAQVSPGSRVLELGPGPGYWSRALADRVPQGHLALCDLQAGMLAMARTKFAAEPVSYLAGDAVALPYRSGAFDAAVLVTVLGEVPAPRACLVELRRVLRAGARLVIAETRLDADFTRFEQLRGMVEPTGFTLDRRYGPPFHYTAIFLRTA
jgi:uncharacterized protein